jgi:hypothetical protein
MYEIKTSSGAQTQMNSFAELMDCYCPNYLFIPGFMLYKEHTNTKEN